MFECVGCQKHLFECNKIYMRGSDPLLDYQFIQGLICHFRKPPLSYFSRVLRATLFKQNLFYSTQIIPARSHPFIKIIQQKHENMVMQVCQKRITKYIYIYNKVKVKRMFQPLVWGLQSIKRSNKRKGSCLYLF